MLQVINLQMLQHKMITKNTLHILYYSQEISKRTKCAASLFLKRTEGAARSSKNLAIGVKLSK